MSLRYRIPAAGLALLLAASTAVLPATRAHARLVATDRVLHGERASELRASWSAALQREEARAALEQHGVDPAEAAARIRSLSDSEVIALAERFADQPLGRGAGEVIVAVLVVFAILVILDATGVTDVFPWIEGGP